MRAGVVFAVILAASTAAAEETARQPIETPPVAHGFLSHGDSSGFMEEAFGDRVERAPNAESGGANKRDPAVRWDVPSATRR